MLLLMAPKIAGYLPAPKQFKDHAPVLLSSAEETLLVNLFNHQQAVAGQKGNRWMPVNKHARQMADNLMLYGYLERHPEKRKRMWYGLTEAGQARAEAAAHATEADNMTFEVSSAMHRVWRDEDLPGDLMKVLRYCRSKSLRRLARDLVHRGFVMYHEAGRSAGQGQQAFHNPATGKKLLYRCRAGRWEWEEHPCGYHTTGQVFDVIEDMQSALTAIPF